MFTADYNLLLKLLYKLENITNFDPLTNKFTMKTYERTINLEFRNKVSKGKTKDVGIHNAYALQSKGISVKYETRERLIKALNDYLTPFLYGSWDELKIDLKAIKYNEQIEG